MYLTMEMRWFWQELPVAIDQWFRHPPLPSTAADREDWYLVLPDTDDVGVKWRQGNLEVKKRLNDRGQQRFGDRLEGHLETWGKWSFESPAAVDLSHPVGVWLAVTKSRQQQTYIVTAGNQVQAIADPDKRATITEGCNLELTKLSVLNQPWFSVCFEAFGRAEAIESTLEQVIYHLLNHENFPALALKDAFSYPAWLKQLEKV